MSRLFDALRQSELRRSGQQFSVSRGSVTPADLLQAVESEALGFKCIRCVQPVVLPESRLVALTDERSLGAEKFRLLATRLKYLQEQRKVQKLLVTSSIAEEGKSVVAANLAITLARRTKQKILLLEGDWRQPVLARLMGLKGLKGCSEWVQDKEPITKFFYQVDKLQLWFLPAGTVPEQPLELLQSSRLSELLRQLTGWFDWVVVDAPPLLPLADVSVWTRLTDGILLVIREGKTPKKLLQKALGTLDNPMLLGVVLNEVTAPDQQYYQRYSAKSWGHKNGRRERTTTRPK